MEKKLPVTPQTGFNIASISKTVAAWGVMKLVEQGKLELDTPVEKYLKRWHLPESEFDKPAPEDFRSFCPTMGDMFTLIATHPMMHAGQFVVVRRQLGKPILM